MILMDRVPHDAVERVIQLIEYLSILDFALGLDVDYELCPFPDLAFNRD